MADFQSTARVTFILTCTSKDSYPISNPEHTKILILHTRKLEQDIRNYINKTLAETVTRSTWYTAADVHALVKLSNSPFILASTALKYVLNPENDALRSVMYELVVTVESLAATIDVEELEGLK